MKRFITILCLLIPFISWAQPQKDLTKTALELCKYIPDHGLNPDAMACMTSDFYKALEEAWAAPVVDYGEIGDNEWLFYFVTGNEAATPIYGIESISTIGEDHAVATISVMQRSDVTGEFFGDIDEYEIKMVRVAGQWLLDDFDDKKSECIDYVLRMRDKYKSGELIEYMESEDYLQEYIPDFKKRVASFYKKYGK